MTLLVSTLRRFGWAVVLCCLIPATSFAAGDRAVSKRDQARIRAILDAPGAPKEQAWFVFSPGDAESRALVDALASPFEAAGWKVHKTPLTGLRLKPGLMFLNADSAPPPYAVIALDALEASGHAFRSATGYRAYYEEKKAADPSWAGIPMETEQAFVVVVGGAPPGAG